MVRVLAGGILLVVGGQHLLLGDASLPFALLVWLTGIAAILGLAWPLTPLGAHSPAEPGTGRAPLRTHQWVLLAVSAIAGLTTLRLLLVRPETGDFTDVTIAWIVSMVALVAAAAGPMPRHRERERPRPQRWEPWALLGVLVAATLARAVALDRYPVLLDADGFSQAIEARDVRQGILTNPFITGFFDSPVLFSFIQRYSMAVFGETATGAMALGAIVGSATVVLTFLLARRLAGPIVGLLAGAVLAAMNAHLHFSRSSLNLVEDGFWIVAVLLLLDIGVAGGQRWACALAGVSAGLSQYFYFSGRLTVPLTIAVVGWFAIRRRREGISGVPAAAAWIAAGTFLAYLPLGLHYLDQPETYASRLDTVSFVGALDAEQERTGEDRTTLIARQVRATVLLPFETEPMSPTFHPPPPLVGWPLAPLVAVGAAMITVAPGRRRHGVLMLWWWASLAGVGMTHQVHVQRWALALPLAAITAGLALQAVGRVLVHRVGMHRRAVAALGTAVVAAIMVANLDAYFRPGNEVAVYSDRYTLVATELGKALHDEPSGTTVVMATAPEMNYLSHSTVRFLAPHVDGQDVLDPMRTEAAVPVTRGPTMFVFLPARLDELEVVKAARPGGRTDEVHAWDGTLLYVGYTVDG